MDPVFFANQSELRKWLKKNHKKEKELLVGFYKAGTNKPSITWSQSVDEALCFGWIDGIRKSIDEDSYTIRFTPRKPSSIWSAINIKKVEDLTEQGLMQPAGFEAFKNRSEEKSRIYSHENERKELPAGFEKKIKSNKKAWEFFSSQAPSYQKVMLHWIMSAKREETRLSRLGKLISESKNKKRVL
ncbi:MAG: YdeI/OmpD-associated family protein [Ferruginibacter sp.]